MTPTVRVEAAGERYDLSWDDRPVNPDTYVAYESLYRTGDTLQSVLGKVTGRKVLTLPEGKFETSDFKPGYYYAGMLMPKTCGGIVGVNPGALGEARGTVLTMKPLSSTQLSVVPPKPKPGEGIKTNPMKLFSCPDPTGPLEFRNFQVACTNQADTYQGNHSGFQVYNAHFPARFENLLLTGHQGDAGAPPGEVMALAVHGRGKFTFKNIEVDSRRAPGGPMFGSAGLTVQNNSGAVLEDVYVHHVRAAGFVAWQAVNGTTKRLRIESNTGDASLWLGNGGLNMERAANWLHEDTVIMGRPRKVHATINNDHWSLPYPDASYPVDGGGTIAFINLKVNDLWGQGEVAVVDTWTPYAIGGLESGYGTMTYPGAGKDGGGRSYNGPDCSMFVMRADGTPVPYWWNLEAGNRTILRGMDSAQLAAFRALHI